MHEAQVIQGFRQGLFRSNPEIMVSQDVKDFFLGLEFTEELF